MTIRINQPEVEALINQRLQSGAFKDVEDVILQALKASSAGAERKEESRDRRTGADLIAALQASPYRELDIEPPRLRLSMPVRDVTF
jgi:Arc/MetJ-type ribon-helix-helix transcriptional regulator